MEIQVTKFPAGQIRIHPKAGALKYLGTSFETGNEIIHVQLLQSDAFRESALILQSWETLPKLDNPTQV